VTEVTLIDFGAGNLRSLRAAFERIGAAVRTSAEPDLVAASPHLVLPGVGAAGPAMRALRRAGLDEALVAALAGGAHLIGVCLGLQLLFERSAEGDTPCLGLLGGSVEPLDWAARLPHMGWNDVVPVGHGGPLSGSTVCYFAHSYVAQPTEPAAIAGETDLDGRSFAAVVASGSLTGVQFHPEKSGPAGRALLASWLGAGVAA
jgi:imidazole glycerol-phosphate synthase subunit HisH